MKKQTKTQKSASKMHIMENQSFTDRVGLVYLAVTCYFFIHSSLSHSWNNSSFKANVK